MLLVCKLEVIRAAVGRSSEGQIRIATCVSTKIERKRERETDTESIVERIHMVAHNFMLWKGKALLTSLLN